MDRYILAKQIAEDLIANPPCEDSSIFFDSPESENMYARTLSFFADDNEWVFHNFRSCNFVDGYDDYVYPTNLHHYISKLDDKDILHLKKVRNIIYREVA
jgi:hypothetical protein